MNDEFTFSGAHGLSVGDWVSIPPPAPRRLHVKVWRWLRWMVGYPHIDKVRMYRITHVACSQVEAE